MNTRARAAAILLRIKEHGAYSNVVLPAATAELGTADRAFVYSLVTGALRQLRTVDAIIEKMTRRPMGDVDAEVLCILEIAIAEMLGDGAPAAYATVNESVNAVKQLGRPQASGLVNGVLRRLVREGMPALPADKARELAVPEWVLGRLTADHGRQRARSLLAGLRQGPPGIGVRIRPGGLPPDGAERVPGIAGAYTVRRLPESLEGMMVCDGASTAVATAVGIRRGERVLDMAAAPGGKTAALWDQGRAAVTLVAMDAHARRLRSARTRLGGLGIRPVWVLGDGTKAPFADGTFDAVLLDAPCTGLGTLRRRPEIAMRLKPKAAAELAQRQREMLAEAWRVTRPGGRIVYSVCTVFAAETIEVVAGYPARSPEDLPGAEWGGGLLLAPHLTGTDAMFISIIRRQG